MLLRTRVRRDSDLIRAVVGTAEGFCRLNHQSTRPKSPRTSDRTAKTLLRPVVLFHCAHNYVM